MVELILAASLFALSLQAQDTTATPYTKKQLDPVEASFLFHYYEQDGNHSAVTGGRGTEQLEDRAMEILLHIPLDTLSTLDIKFGANFYTSASTDNINFIVSSPSAEDGHYELQASYERSAARKRRAWGAEAFYSIESDYVSRMGGVSWRTWSRDENRTASVSANAFFDNVEWYNKFKHKGLIYPKLLRDTAWYTINHRNTYAVSMSLTQVLNKRLHGGIFGDVVYQEGILGTTFHRVYFSDITNPRVERLPMERLKFPVGVRANYYLGGRVIVRSWYRLYNDDFGIQAHSASLEIPVKLTAFFSVYPFYRYHTQRAASFFAPKGFSYSTQDYYTSDYDLSSFDSHLYGLGLRYAPVYGLFRFKPLFLKQKSMLKEVNLRVSNYQRSDGLHAQSVSFGMLFRRY